MSAKIKMLFVLLAMVAGGASFAQAQNVSEEMTQFMEMLDGSEEAATKAIEHFGSEEVIANGMIPYGENGKITSVDDNCYAVTLEDDGDENEYVLCWEDGKVSLFDWADMLEDDDEDE